MYTLSVNFSSGWWWLMALQQSPSEVGGYQLGKTCGGQINAGIAIKMVHWVGGPHGAMDSVLALHPAALSLIPGIPKKNSDNIF